MNQLPAPYEQLPAKQSAYADLLASQDEQRAELDTYFQAKDARKAEIARVREKSEATLLERTLLDERHLERDALMMASRLRTLSGRSRWKAARVWAQLKLLANALDLDRDEPPPPPRVTEDGPVFDRTSTGRRQGATKYGPQGDELLRRAAANAEAAEKNVISASAVQEMLESMAASLPIVKKPGRPSNKWQASLRHAEGSVAAEQALAAQSGEEIGVPEAAERLLARLRAGTSPLRLIQGGRAVEADLTE